MDTLEFTEKKTFIFSPELSAPLTGDEEVTIIHPLVAVRICKNHVNHTGFFKNLENSSQFPAGHSADG